MKTAMVRPVCCCACVSLFVAALAMLLSATRAEASTIAQSYGVEFGIGSNQYGTPTPGLTPSQVAGVVPTANWNLATSGAANGSIAAGSLVKDTNGVGSTANTVSVAWTSGDIWDNGGTSNFTNANDNILNNGYLDGESGGHATVTFSGLTPGSMWDVYITSTGGTRENKGGNMVVNGVDDHALSGANTSGGYVQATSSVQGNYHFFLTAADSSGDISIITGGSDPTLGRIPINSVELIPVTVPEPSTIALFSIGAVGVLLVARRRRCSG